MLSLIVSLAAKEDVNKTSTVVEEYNIIIFLLSNSKYYSQYNYKNT